MVPVFSMIRKSSETALTAVIAAGLACALAASGQDQSKSSIPDAPSATRPFPTVPQPAPPSSPPARTEPPAGTDTGSQPDASAPPPFKVTTVPAGSANGQSSPANEELFKITVNTNQVVVPVMVKDGSGRLVNGLLARDFSVYEDGKKMNLNFFTTDPFSLAAAVIFDLGMPDIAVQKVNQTFSALEGAFSAYDEVSIYTYSSSATRVTDFATVGRKLTQTLDSLKMVSGRNNGPPITSGPLGPQGPTVNGVPLDPGSTRVYTPPKESHVLNDALVMAAQDLSKRDRSRRKVIFVISDGRESRSNASYSDTLKVLLSHGILVYGVAVEGSAIPGYGSLQKLHVPLMTSRVGYSNILPKYANATGGEIFTGLSREAIEVTYARALSDARNQYTLGYVTHASPSSAHREIEVRVARPDLHLTAKEGYYPVGLAR